MRGGAPWGVMTCLLGAALGVIALVVVASSVHAQELEPRAYVNTPVGLNFLIAGYGYLENGVPDDASVPLRDAKVQTHAAVFAYVRSLDVWGKSGKFNVILPYAWTSGSATIAEQPRQRDVSGFGDPRFRFSVNLYGAPALSLKEFADYKQDVIVGASLLVSAPGGQYDSSRLLNIGTNRWSVRPEVGISKALGPVTLELATGVTFYTDNGNFLGGKTLGLDPIYSVEGHLVYNFGRGAWGAVDGTYYTGGRTTVAGVRGNDRQENVRVGVTLALPVDRHNSIKLYGSVGAYTRTGADFDAVGIAWQYRWGGGR